MARKGSLVASMAVAKAKAEAEAAPLEPVKVADDVTSVPASPPINRASDAMITTAVHIPRDVHILLRRVAVERANEHGGRPSVSAVLTELVRRHWDELAGETGR